MGGRRTCTTDTPFVLRAPRSRGRGRGASRSSLVHFRWFKTSCSTWLRIHRLSAELPGVGPLRAPLISCATRPFTHMALLARANITACLRVLISSRR